MTQYLVGCGVVFLLHHVGVPLYSNMAFLEKVLDRNQGRFDQTAAALLDPVALAAGVALTIDHLENKGLKPLAIGESIFPFRLVPPEFVMCQVLAVFFQHVVG